MSLHEIEYLPTGRLKLNPKNAKTHPVKQVRQIAQSIRSFGFNAPILIDEADIVIAGHGRLVAAGLLALETVPGATAHLTPAQKLRMSSPTTSWR